MRVGVSIVDLVPEDNVIAFPTKPNEPSQRSAVGLAERDDDALMRLASAGTRPAFAALVARHAGRLNGFCIKMTSDRRTGEDVAQETWLQLWASRKRYKPEGKFDSFLYTIARNRCRNALRSARRRGRVQSDVELDTESFSSDEPSHLDAILDNERRDRVHRAMATLSPKFREALLLRYSQDLDYAQIATIVGRSESTVRSRVHHGIKKLRTSLERNPN